MSTKTTFKRVALVTVAALGLGVLSVAPSSAAVQLDSVTVSAASTTQNTTETLTATAVVVTGTLAGKKGVDTLTVTASIVSGPAYVAPVLVFKESTTAEIGGTSPAVTVNPRDTATVTQATGKWSLYLNAPTVVGTYVVKLTPTGGTNAVATTVSIVVSAIKIQGPSATNSKMFLGVSATTGIDDRGAFVQGSSGARYSGLYEGYAGGLLSNNQADTRTISVPLAGTLIGSGAWQLFGANTSVPAARTPVTYTISGPAYIALQTDASSPYSTLIKDGSITESKLVTVGHDPYDPASQNGSFWLFATGTGGVVTVTATMDGVQIGKRSFSIIGDPTAYVFGTPSKTVTGVGETSSVTVTGTDKVGTSTGAASVYAFSSDTSVATVNSSQASTVVITGVKSGTATITVGNASTLATSTITKTLAIKVGAITAKTVALSMSPLAPQPGELVTLTVTATDASGNAVGDGSRNLFSSTGLTTSLAVQGATWTASAAVTLKGGIATYTFYAPTGTGKLTVTATEGASTDNVIAAGTAATITSSVDVTNAAVDAATVAAEAAEAAAQDATDAALDATTAAEAAGALAQEAVDLVTALSAEVTKLIEANYLAASFITNLVR